MSHSTVKVIDLWAVANLMKKDRMQYVCLSIDEEDGSISFSASKSLTDDEVIDYDPLDPVSDNPLL